MSTLPVNPVRAVVLQQKHAALWTSAGLIATSVTLGLLFAFARFPFMGDTEHFITVGPSRPFLHSILHSFSVQFFIGPSVCTPVSRSMQLLYIAQMALAFLFGSALFSALAFHIDAVLHAHAQGDAHAPTEL